MRRRCWLRENVAGTRGRMQGNSDTQRLLWRLWGLAAQPRLPGGEGELGSREEARLLQSPRLAAWLTFNDFSNFEPSTAGVCVGGVCAGGVCV